MHSKVGDSRVNALHCSHSQQFEIIKVSECLNRKWSSLLLAASDLGQQRKIVGEAVTAVGIDPLCAVIKPSESDRGSGIWALREGHSCGAIEGSALQNERTLRRRAERGGIAGLSRTQVALG